MALNWDELESATPATTPVAETPTPKWEELTASPEESRKSLATDIVHDVGIGTLELPGAVTGLADIPAGLMGFDRPFSKGAEKLGEITGFQPGKWAEEAEKTAYSPERVAAEQRVSKAWEDYDTDKTGIFSAVGKTLAEPRVLAGTVFKSAPSMAGGMGLARGAKALAPSLSPVVAGAGGEGAIMAGQQMEQIDESVDPQRAAIASALTGVGGGALSYAGGKVAGKWGFTDLETMAAGGEAGAKALPIYKRVPAGAIQEGLLEEAPQSALEQASQNIAEGKDATEGMARAVTQGALAGGVMGAGTNILPSGETVAPPPTTDEQAATPEPDFAEVPDGNPQEPIIAGAPTDESSEKPEVAVAKAVPPNVKGAIRGYVKEFDANGSIPEADSRFKLMLSKAGIRPEEGESIEKTFARLRAAANPQIKFEKGEYTKPKTPEEALQRASGYVANMVGNGKVPTSYYSSGKVSNFLKALVGTGLYDHNDTVGEAWQKLQDFVAPKPVVPATPNTDAAVIQSEETDKKLKENLGTGAVSRAAGAAIDNRLTPEQKQNDLDIQAASALDEQQNVEMQEAEQVTELSDFEPEIPWEEYDDSIPFGEPAPVVPLTPEELENMRIARYAKIHGIKNADEQTEADDAADADYYARLEAAATETPLTQQTPEVEDGKSPYQTAQTTTQEVAPPNVDNVASEATREGSENREDENRKLREAIDKLQKNSDNLQRANRYKDEAIGLYRSKEKIDPKTGNRSYSAYKSDPRKNIQVSIDADSLKWVNDNLGRGAGDELLAHIGKALSSQTKDSYHVSGDEFIVQADSVAQARTIMRNVENELAKVSFGNDAYTVNGIGISYGIDSKLARADEKLQAHKTQREVEGKRAPRGEQPYNISNTTKEVPTAPNDEVAGTGEAAGEIAEANEVWTNTEAQAEKANKLIAESEKRGVPIKTYSLFKMGSGTNEIILSTGNKAISIDANGNHDTFHMPTLQLNIAAGNAKEFTGKLDPALRKPVLPTESKPTARQGGIAAGVYRSPSAPSTPVYKVDESGAIFRANTLGNWVKLSARAKDPLANLNSVRWELENNGLKFEREDLTPETPKSEVSQELQEAGITEAYPIDLQAHKEAAASRHNGHREIPDNRDAQKKAYVSIKGVNIGIENPAGTKRRPEWPELKDHYGFVVGVKGADGDYLDVFIKPGMTQADIDSVDNVYIVDQKNEDGSFDEHKVILGPDNVEAAKTLYLENYDKGWQGLGAITEMPFDEFKERIDSGKNWDEPVAYKELASKVEVKKPESPEQKKAIAAVAKRFGIPATTVSDVVNSTSDELQNREDDPTYPAGLARIGKYGDLNERYVEFVKRFKPSELMTSEFEQGIKKHPSYAEYLALAKAGSKPPLISVSETYSGGMQSSNRRRTLVAQELNKPIDGWFSPINKETGDPLKYGDILRAMGEKIPATKVEEKLAPEEKPADQTSETGFEESVEAAEEQVPETELTVQPEPTKGKPVADDFLKLMVDFNRQQEKKYRLVDSDVKPTIGKGGRLHAPHNGYEWIDGNIYAGGQWLAESEDSIRGSRPSKATIEATPEVAAYLEEQAKDFDQIRVSLGKVYEKNGENRQYVYVEGGRALTRAITDLAPSRNKVLMAASEAEAKGLTLGKTWKYSYKKHFNEEMKYGTYLGSDESLDRQIVGYYYPDAVIRDIGGVEEPVAESPKTEEKQELATADTFIEKYKAYSSDKREEARQLVEDLIVTKKENGQPYQNLTDRLALMAAVDRGEDVSDTDNWVYATPVSGHPENLDTELTRNLVPIKVSSVADAERKLFNAQDIYSAAVRDFSTAKRNLEIAKTAASKKAAKAAIDALSKRGIHEQSIESLRDETLPELDRLVKEAEKKFGKEPPIPFSRVETSEPLPELFESLGRVNKLSQLSDDQLQRIDEHPDAERIRYVQDNFLTLLSELDARPNSEFEIKC